MAVGGEEDVQGRRRVDRGTKEVQVAGGKAEGQVLLSGAEARPG